MRQSGVAVGLLAVVALSGSAGAGVLMDYNLVVLGNLTSTSEVEGRTFVGGNLGGPSSTYGTMLTPASNWLGVDVLSVAGNINVANQINLNAGNLRRGGSRSGGLNLNGGGQEIVDPSLPLLVPGIAAELNSASQYLGALTADSSVTLPGGQPGPAVFNGTPGADGIAVFNISGAALFQSGLVQQIELNTGGASQIVVNVSGTSINWNTGNMVGNWLLQSVRANTIWNFFEATSLTFDRNFNGAVLAPLAHLTNTTAIDGSVFVGSMTANGEVHLPNYTGLIPAPGSVGVLVAGGLLAARRRRVA